jgi:hypothetical protein
MSAQREPTPIEEARRQLARSRGNFAAAQRDLVRRIGKWVGPVEMFFLSGAALIAAALSYIGTPLVLGWCGLVAWTFGVLLLLAQRGASR